MSKAPLLVAGDQGMEQYVFVDRLPEDPPYLHEAWVNAKDFWAVPMPGGAGQLAAYLGADEARLIPNHPCAEADPTAPESVYVLTNQAEDRERDIRWKLALSLVAGERRRCPLPVDLREFGGTPSKRGLAQPVVVMDFYQGWVDQNRETLPDMLRGRHYMVRTHDPVRLQGAADVDLWRQVRQRVGGPGLWFSPHQDMADGELRITGNWENLRQALTEYLREDDTLWTKQSGWKHAVVIQVFFDGALVLGPGRRETLVVFPGDQPESFSRREKKSQVVGGGIIIAASLASLLRESKLEHSHVMKQTCEGLARARELTRQGYDAQAAKTGTIYPRTVLKTITSTSPDYPMKYDPPRESVATALEIIGADDRAFREQLVFSLGKLNTCDANFAQQLLLLRQRIETHLAQPKPGVLSFAVFGGPGSGKSFVVSQVQESLGSDLAEKSVNVSQFADPEHLRRELVDVQALSLQDKIPFVLWDEFDCRYEDEQGGWLSKFLMPMQDGAFWDGGTRRALGKCVFVFVGGTWSSAGAFSNWVDTDPKAVLLKGRDFHSRLDRVLEIPSVDLRVGNKPALGCPLLNRAIFIRSKLRDLDAIDRNVAEFLLAARLRHGIRSLDTIIAASALRRTKRFTARQLPPPAVLGIHVVGHAVPTGPTDPLKINH